MDLQEILTRFALIANLNLEEAAPWITICNEAASQLRSKLKDPDSEDKNSERLNAAAAALSFYKYTIYRSSGLGMNNFSIGDIRINSDSKISIDTAKSILDDAMSDIHDLLLDNDFLFKRM